MAKNKSKLILVLNAQGEHGYKWGEDGKLEYFDPRNPLSRTRARIRATRKGRRREAK